jgi:thiosulfate reductase cytochrome b subunit
MFANLFTAPSKLRAYADEPLAGSDSISRGVEQGVQLRHRVVVRVTHWAMVLGVFGLLVSGTGILISHPRLYWGETGAIGTPSLIDLPLPMIIGPSVWNRPIHFLFAWVLVLSGVVYLAAGLFSRHFRDELLPAKPDLNWTGILGVIRAHLRWKKIGTDEAWTYNVVQRLVYLAVVFAIFPAIVWTGLAMSFAVTSVFPFLVTVLGGHQSARTLHFIFVSLLVAFLAIHIAMLFLVGFKSHVQAMITGRIPQRETAP